jgi:hypothetical protein
MTRVRLWLFLPFSQGSGVFLKYLRLNRNVVVNYRKAVFAFHYLPVPTFCDVEQNFPALPRRRFVRPGLRHSLIKSRYSCAVVIAPRFSIKRSMLRLIHCVLSNICTDEKVTNLRGVA